MSRTLQMILRNEPENFNTFLSAKLCARAIAYGDVNELLNSCESLDVCLKAHREYLPVRLVKKTCGLSILEFNKEHARQLREQLSINSSCKDSYNKLMCLLLPVGFEVNEELYAAFNTIRKSSVKKSILQRQYCDVSMGKCKCPPIEGDNSVIPSLQVIRDSLITDADIANYLEANPVEERVEKFGKPQSKYRNGTYGLHGMEYDRWSK
ncbi:hypothetical protein [Vibrio hyugaensis]|uniref:hypothetical protein n=1 Tax=Vibrio hyugaensis TaxID=1534743 RepID=UPI000CE3E016|nr:hypothetical protein [Vibrio hyugaensis]